MELQGLVGYVLFALQIAVVATAVYAFVHAALQRPDAYEQALPAPLDEDDLR